MSDHDIINCQIEWCEDCAEMEHININKLKAELSASRKEAEGLRAALRDLRCYLRFIPYVEVRGDDGKILPSAAFIIDEALNPEQRKAGA